MEGFFFLVLWFVPMLAFFAIMGWLAEYNGWDNED